MNRSGGATVQLMDVERRYGSVDAVRNLSLTVQPGEFLTLLGSSGCGKTTTLMMIAGFDSPSSGEILINGRTMTRVPPHLRDQGFVFQHYALFPHMTVSQNLAFALQVRGVSQAEQRSRVARMIERFGLHGLGERLPQQLSGGQQQRTALARALIHDPPLLLMDEPLAALDKNLRSQLQQEIKTIQKEFNVTVLYVTHDQEEAMAMSDRIAVMNRGVLEQVDAPEKLYEHPGSAFVARFMGEMNFIDGTVAGIEGERVLIAASGGLTLDARPGAPGLFAPGTHVKVTVRPERLKIAPQRGDSSMQWVDAVVSKRTYLGETEKYVLAVRGHTLVARRQCSRGEPRFEPGDHLAVGWNDRDLGTIRV
jgi:spermidine/putrescine ABC transporter ATP-binding subunit